MHEPRIDLEAFAALFTDEDGVLPDGAVLGSGAGDWARILSAFDARGWLFTRVDLETSENIPTTGAAIEPLIGTAPVVFAVYPRPRVRVNFFAFADSIQFDIDRREYTTQEALDALSELLAVTGRATAKPVAIVHEGTPGPVILRFAGERFVLGQG